VVPVDVASGRQGTPIQAPDRPIAGIAASPDGGTIWSAITGNGGDVVATDVRANRVGVPVRLGHDPIAMALSPDGKWLYVLGGASTVDELPGQQYLWVVSTASQKIVRSMTFTDPVNALVVAPDGRMIYIQNQDTSVTPVSTVTWTKEAVIHSTRLLANGDASLPAAQPVSSLVISPDGRTLYDSNGTGVAVIPVSGWVPGPAPTGRGPLSRVVTRVT
jgi:ABC-type uncharacterized transport system permease subunit